MRRCEFRVHGPHRNVASARGPLGADFGMPLSSRGTGAPWLRDQMVREFPYGEHSDNTTAFSRFRPNIERTGRKRRAASAVSAGPPFTKTMALLAS